MENIIATILAVTGLMEIYVLIYLIASPREGKRKSQLLRLEKLNVFLALFFVMTLGAFFFLNGQAYAENISFDLKSAFGGSSEQVPNEPIFVFPTGTPLHSGGAATGGGSTTTPRFAVLPLGSPMTLTIPKIGITVPIVMSADTSTKGVLKSLESGVGMYPGSSMPGQAGHMIVLGHSSRASWYHGDYARVFSLLNKMVVGDEFTITSGNTKYVYKIFSNQVLSPAATDAYLARPATDSVIDLITCFPVGSAANRTIVSAKRLAAGQ